MAYRENGGLDSPGELSGGRPKLITGQFVLAIGNSPDGAVEVAAGGDSGDG